MKRKRVAISNKFKKDHFKEDKRKEAPSHGTILILMISATKIESKRKFIKGKFQEEAEWQSKSLTKRWGNSRWQSFAGIGRKEGREGIQKESQTSREEDLWILGHALFNKNCREFKISYQSQELAVVGEEEKKDTNWRYLPRSWSTHELLKFVSSL